MISFEAIALSIVIIVLIILLLLISVFALTSNTPTTLNAPCTTSTNCHSGQICTEILQNGTIVSVCKATLNNPCTTTDTCVSPLICTNSICTTLSTSADLISNQILHLHAFPLQSSLTGHHIPIIHISSPHDPLHQPLMELSTNSDKTPLNLVSSFADNIVPFRTEVEAKYNVTTPIFQPSTVVSQSIVTTPHDPIKVLHLDTLSQSRGVEPYKNDSLSSTMPEESQMSQMSQGTILSAKELSVVIHEASTQITMAVESQESSSGNVISTGPRPLSTTRIFSNGKEIISHNIKTRHPVHQYLSHVTKPQPPNDVNVVDVCVYSDEIIFLMSDGSIKCKNESTGTTRIVNSNVPLTRIVSYEGYLHGLGPRGILYILDETNDITWNWRISSICNTISSIIHISVPYDGNGLWIQTATTGYLYHKESEIPQSVTLQSAHIIRNYGKDTTTYIESDTENRVLTVYPNGKQMEDVVYGILSYHGDIIVLDRVKEQEGYIRIVLVHWKPYYIK
jgi:hypothetical protein